MPLPSSRVPSIVAVLAVVAVLLLMSSFLSPLFAAKAEADYPRLAENKAASARLEVRKVLHGDIDGLFAVPGRDQVLVAADGYLFKFGADGRLLDTLREPGYLHTSGVAFGPDGYVDWVFTGDRGRKTYAPMVDGNALTPAALAAALDQAQVVAFGRDDDGTAAWAWLWRDGKAWKLDITRYRDQVDPYCTRPSQWWRTLEWEHSCLEGYTHHGQGLREIEPGPFDGGDATPPRVEVVGFDRRHYHLEEGIGGQLVGATVGQVLKRVWKTPGELPGRYWFGDARVRLHVDGETLRFKVFVPQIDGEYEFMRNMRWWEPAAELPGAGPWFSVHMRDYMEGAGEETLLRYYAADIGLYAVRPKGVDDVPAAQREVPGWRPVFEGPKTWRSAVTGIVELASGERVHRWLRPPAPWTRAGGMPPQTTVDVEWPDLHGLPRKLLVEWDTRDEAATLQMELSPEGTRAAFDALRGAEGTVELVLQMPDLYSDADAMQVLLRRGDSKAAVTGARLAYVHRPPFRPVVEGGPSRLEQLQASLEAAKDGDSSALHDFLQKAQALALDPERAAAFAPGITAAYAQLLIAYNHAGDAASAATLVRHYLAQVHPLTHAFTEDASVPYNIGVIASQTLAFALHQPQERALVDAVLATLVGPDFDPDAQTNDTLLYNLACHYALAGDKPRMLRHVAAARRLGKPAAQFLQDGDFQRYRTDKDFLRVLR